MRLALIIRLTIGKAYYENTFRVFHHSLVSDSTHNYKYQCSMKNKLELTIGGVGNESVKNVV